MTGMPFNPRCAREDVASAEPSHATATLSLRMQRHLAPSREVPAPVHGDSKPARGLGCPPVYWSNTEILSTFT